MEVRKLGGGEWRLHSRLLVTVLPSHAPGTELTAVLPCTFPLLPQALTFPYRFFIAWYGPRHIMSNLATN